VSGPLSDLKVIDLGRGQTAGMTTMVLADFGADVVKVEPPGGDPERALANAPLWLRGKRSVVLDLEDEGGRAQLRELVRGADVVVASDPPGVAERVGADYDSLSALNPRLVYCSLTGWGPRGDYAHYPAREALVAAKSGRMLSFRGLPRREGPAFAAVQVGSHAASQAAVHGIMAALLERERSGAGQLVETSLLQGMIPYDAAGLTRLQLQERYAGLLETEFSDDAARMPTLNYHPVMASDGRWIQLGNLLEHLFVSFLVAADLADVLGEERYSGQPAAWADEDREAMRDRILLRMRDRSSAEWMETFRENGNVAAEPFESTQEALENVEYTSNGDVVTVDHPRLGEVRWLAPLARLEETPGSAEGIDPLVGEHSEEVLAALSAADGGASPEGTTGAASNTASGRPPLEGVTILEFATIIAAPLAASLLSDLGARVIKVEPIGGDPGRRAGGNIVAGLGSIKFNAGKESICIDLKSTEGQEILAGLLPSADVILHNYRPGVPERLGIGYEQVRAVNPKAIWVSATGYGPEAPGAHRPCAHPIAGAAAGGALYQAGVAMPPSDSSDVRELREAARWMMRANEVNPDPNTSMVIASATLLGLYAARREGVGQRIFVNMLAANAYANHDDALSYAGKPERSGLDADLYGLSATHRLYRSSDGWVFLSVADDEEWAGLSEAVGDAVLDASEFATSAGRVEHDGRLAEVLEGVFTTRGADAWEELLIAAGVGCVRADANLPGPFFLGDGHVADNGFAATVDHPRFGRFVRHGPTVTLSRSGVDCGPGSLAGLQTDELLADLGFDAGAIADLRERSVVWSEAVEALETT